jgi:hypothetical protein
MLRTEFVTFDRAFGRVCGAFQRKLKPAEQRDASRTYFLTMEDEPLELVLEAGKRCIQSFKHFPRVSEWLTEVQALKPAAILPLDRRHTTVTEGNIQEEAKRRHYQDAPCACDGCCAAGVQDKPVRFVPTIIGVEEERAFNQQRQRVEIVGHWAHGEELRRWYASRRAFLRAFATDLHGRTMRPVPAFTPDRELGEEG